MRLHVKGLKWISLVYESTLNDGPAIKGNRSRDIKNDLITSNRNDKYHHTRLIDDKLTPGKVWL